MAEPLCLSKEVSLEITMENQQQVFAIRFNQVKSTTQSMTTTLHTRRALQVNCGWPYQFSRVDVVVSVEPTLINRTEVWRSSVVRNDKSPYHQQRPALKSNLTQRFLHIAKIRRKHLCHTCWLRTMSDEKAHYSKSVYGVPSFWDCLGQQSEYVNINIW